MSVLFSAMCVTGGHLPVPFSCLKQHALVRLGRAEVLQVIHEDASADTLYPYLSYRFRPCKVLQMFSRSAKQPPECRVDETLWYFWRVALPVAAFLFPVHFGVRCTCSRVSAVSGAYVAVNMFGSGAGFFVAVLLRREARTRHDLFRRGARFPCVRAR